MVSASRVALLGAVGAVVGWAVKALAIGLAGGLDRSPAEGPLFLLGLVAALVGAAAFGAALTSGRPLAVRVLAGAAVIAGVMLAAGLGGWVVTVVQPADPGWVWGEVNLWVACVVLLTAVLVWRAAHDRPRPVESGPTAR